MDHHSHTGLHSFLLSFFNLRRTTQVMAVFRSSSSRYGARRPARRAYKARPRRLSNRSTALTIPRAPSSGGFPPTMTTNMRYCDNILLTSYTGSVAGNIFRINSLFDPDYTGVGHQPLYFDQFAASYGRYVVLGCKATYRFATLSQSPDSAPVGPYQIGVIGSNQSSFPNSRTLLAESNNSITDLMARADGGPCVKTIVMSYIPSRDIGLPSTDDTVGASVGTNPTATYFMYPWVSDLNNTQSVVQLQVTFEYRVKWYMQGYTASS